ncbi:MAG: DUF3499 domain-containing protein [Ornithinimicrobium sp.]
MTIDRRCSRTACGQSAVVTLTYVYGEQTAVLGPLATYAEPHSYDLCEQHGSNLTAPRGWDIVRLESPDGSPTPADDLVALADAVREQRRAPQQRPAPPTPSQRPHLRVLRD